MNGNRPRSDFPWTLDQYQRYSVLLSFLETFYLTTELKVLDVGGLSPERDGQSCWLPVQRIFRGKSYSVDPVFCREKNFVQADGLYLPFRDGSFDVVAALDVIEHIAQGQRRQLLGELCRVAKRAVVISAPFSDQNIEWAESMLQGQIKNLYGAVHRQLREHSDKGLPEISAITQMLRDLMPAGIDFSYGSLANWLSLQAVKNVFMFRRNSGAIQASLDQWLAAILTASEAEFTPPFSRHYWMFTKDVPRDDLEKGLDILRRKLKSRKSNGLPIDDYLELPREISEFFCGDRVSALVVAETGRNLRECLNHLLTQDVPFDFEVAVWNLRRSEEVKKIVGHDFPVVRCLEARADRRADNALLELLAGLQGSILLLLSEDILLPATVVRDLYPHLVNDDAAAVLLSPRIVKTDHAYGVWLGRKFSLSRCLAGRLSSIFWRLKLHNPSWIYSECLMLKREAFSGKRLSAKSLKKRNLFFWGRSDKQCQWAYVPDIVVYQK